MDGLGVHSAWASALWSHLDQDATGLVCLDDIHRTLPELAAAYPRDFLSLISKMPFKPEPELLKEADT